MSQTDYSIANSSGAVFRARVNEVNAAIKSSNSGPTAPTDTGAGMLWRDTSESPPVLRIRNDSDDGWDTLADYLAGTLSTALKVVSVDENTSALSGATPSLDVSVAQDFSLTTSANTTVSITGTPAGEAWVRTLVVTLGGAHTFAITSANWGDIGAPTGLEDGDVIEITLRGVGATFRAAETWRSSA